MLNPCIQSAQFARPYKPTIQAASVDLGIPCVNFIFKLISMYWLQQEINYDGLLDV